MARISAHLNAVGDVCGPIFEAEGRISHAAMFLGAGVVGTVVMEISNQTVNNDGKTDEWVTLSGTALTDATNTGVAQLVGGGNALYACSNFRAVRKVRLRKSAGAADPNGTAIVTLTTEVSSMS